LDGAVDGHVVERLTTTLKHGRPGDVTTTERTCTTPCTPPVNTTHRNFFIPHLCQMFSRHVAFNALTPLVGRQEELPACKN